MASPRCCFTELTLRHFRRRPCRGLEALVTLGNELLFEKRFPPVSHRVEGRALAALGPPRGGGGGAGGGVGGGGGGVDPPPTVSKHS